MHPLEIPGYREAVERESLIRDAAFLGVPERIGPYEVRPMTLRHYLILRTMSSPLLSGGEITPTALAAFLWVVSVENTDDAAARDRFYSRCAEFCPPRRGLILAALSLFRLRKLESWLMKRWLRRVSTAETLAAKIVTDALGYIAEAFQDKPPVRQSFGWSPSYYSEAAAWCGFMAREYGWDQSQTLETPLKVLFQYRQEAKAANGSKEPLANPSDRITAEWSLTQQRN